MARARGSRNDLVSATRVNRSSEIGAREQKIQPPLQKSCDGGCDFYFVSDASIHTLIIVEALTHHFITGEYYGPCRAPLAPGWNELVPGRIRAQYFEVPHDASFTYGYALMLDDYKFVIMTDIGRMVPQALAFAQQADTVVIESNYDLEMLRHGPYPKVLQDRICGGHGHLSNAECAEAIRDFLHPGLRNIFLCHLSEHNNTPQLAFQASSDVLREFYTPCAPSRGMAGYSLTRTGASAHTSDGTDLQGQRPPRLCPLPRMTASPLFIL